MNSSPLAHIPVLFKPVLEATIPLSTRAALRGLDATFGRGGHARGLLDIHPQLHLEALDQDPAALDYGRENFASEIRTGRLQLHHTNFAEFDLQSGPPFDIILVDLGVSSPQLDDGSRGFSFYEDGPLDMRMNPQSTTTLTASQVLHSLEENELIEMFQELGEVRSPYRVVRAIVHDRKTMEFATTRPLASMIERIDGWRIKGKHPATQYFLALRLYVNRELEVTKEALPRMMERLTPGGRMIVLTFHSLEDRIVKYIFKDSNLGRPVNKKVIEADTEEAKLNPRSRSAKMRIFERNSEE